ncbi:hypothetical protein [Aquincola sp. J276]|uniref:hypothetical protein n=1 Tax=Aquincola sp. J276 TaxID=2898432 RepID=UPI0021513240|nr:hypothetical protein [Aquincola sp. J276]MCR5864647.1 hypothetical protein [Aquincola sp. J276]
MSTRDLPVAMRIGSMEWGHSKASLQFAGPYNGTRQAMEYLAERFVVSLTFNAAQRRQAGGVEGFVGWLTGGANRVRLYHLARPQPAGSLRGSPTLQAGVGRGAVALTLATVPGATLRMGDLFGCGGQLFQCADDCTANGAGLIMVPVVHRVRGSIAPGSAVVWDRPTAEFIVPATTGRYAYMPGSRGPVQIDLEETW